MATDEMEHRARRQHSRLSNSSGAAGGAGSQNQFDQNHSRYRTCCGCHVRGCSLIIGILEMIALVAAVVGTAVAYFALPSQESPTADGQKSAISAGLLSHAELSLIGSVAALLIGSVVVALLIYGLIKERPAFLIPHLIAQLTAIIGLAAAVIVFVYVTVTEADYGPMITMSGNRSLDRHVQPEYMELVYGSVVIGLCGLACLLEIYFAIVIYRTYAYFLAKRRAQEKTQNIQLRSSSTSFPGQDSIAAQRYWVQN